MPENEKKLMNEWVHAECYVQLGSEKMKWVKSKEIISPSCIP